MVYQSVLMLVVNLLCLVKSAGFAFTFAEFSLDGVVLMNPGLPKRFNSRYLT